MPNSLLIPSFIDQLTMQSKRISLSRQAILSKEEIRGMCFRKYDLLQLFRYRLFVENLQHQCQGNLPLFLLSLK